MNESGPFDPSKTQDWIDQERERLRGQREHADQQPGTDAWINSLREWLRLLRPDVGGMFGQDELRRTLQGLGLAHAAMMESLAKIPPLGLAGSCFAPWSELQTADAEYRKVAERFREALVDVHMRTLDELERRLKSRAAPPLDERELYDLWIECGEAVFSKIAHSAEFAQLQGSMSNAAVHRVRAQKAVLEQIARMYDLPTRSELNSVLQQLRTMRRELDSLKVQSRTKSESASKQKASPKGIRKASKSPRGKSRKVPR